MTPRAGGAGGIGQRHTSLPSPRVHHFTVRGTVSVIDRQRGRVEVTLNNGRTVAFERGRALTRPRIEELNAGSTLPTPSSSSQPELGVGQEVAMEFDGGTFAPMSELRGAGMCAPPFIPTAKALGAGQEFADRWKPRGQVFDIQGPLPRWLTAKVRSRAVRNELEALTDPFERLRELARKRSLVGMEIELHATLLHRFKSRYTELFDKSLQGPLSAGERAEFERLRDARPDPEHKHEDHGMTRTRQVNPDSLPLLVNAPKPAGATVALSQLQNWSHPNAKGPRR